MFNATSLKQFAVISSIASSVAASALLAPAALAETVLTGYVTTGADMAGASITASFLDGGSETLTWSAFGSDGNEGGVFSDLGWSLTQKRDSFSYPWLFSVGNSLSIETLTIDLFGGNSVFDTILDSQSAQNTDGSKQGKPFAVKNGLAPESVEYSTPIDISQGDLFSTLTLGWENGFSGVLEFVADTDSGTEANPVVIVEPVIAEPVVVEQDLPPVILVPIVNEVVEIAIDTPAATSVPEPGTLLGLLAIAGLGRKVAQRRQAG